MNAINHSNPRLSGAETYFPASLSSSSPQFRQRTCQLRISAPHLGHVISCLVMLILYTPMLALQFYYSQVSFMCWSISRVLRYKSVNRKKEPFYLLCDNQPTCSIMPTASRCLSVIRLLEIRSSLIGQAEVLYVRQVHT